MGETLFEGLLADDERAARRLHQIIQRGVLKCVPGVHAAGRQEDLAQDIFLIVYQAVRDRSIRQPQALLGFVRTVIRRHCGTLIGDLIEERNKRIEVSVTVMDSRAPIEKQIIEEQQLGLIQGAMQRLPQSFRMVLEDFYLGGLPREQIMARYDLTETSYRLAKSRSLARIRKAVGSRTARRGARVA